jgi:hypothetical protein
MEANTNNGCIRIPAHLNRIEILRRRLFRKIPKPVVEKILDFIHKFQKLTHIGNSMLLFLDYCRSGAFERTLG